MTLVMTLVMTLNPQSTGDGRVVAAVAKDCLGSGSWIRHTRMVGIVCCLTLAGCDSIPSAPQASTSAEAGSQSRAVVAVWGDDSRAVARADYDDWRAWRQLDDGLAAIEEFVFLNHLASAARERGIEGLTSYRMRLEARRMQLLGQALDSHIAAQAKVTDSEVEEAIETYPDAFRRPRKLLLRNIFKVLPDSATEAAAVRASMEALRDRLKQGGDFKELARQESQSQTRFRDGLMGRFALQDLPDTVAEALVDIEQGGISEVVEQGGGLTLFYCERIDAAVSPGADEVRKKIRSNLLRQRIRENTARLHEQLRDSHATPQALSEAELDELVRMRHPARAVDEVPAARIASLREDWAMDRLRAEHARQMGLDTDEELARALRWAPAQLLARSELTGLIDARMSEPAQAELLEHFEANSNRYRMLRQFQLAAIHFGGHDPDTVRVASDVSGRISRGELDFAEAARLHSKDGSAESGGLWGWKNVSQISNWDPILLKAAGQLSVGDNTGLLRLKSGVWLFELRGRQEGRPMRFEEAVTRVRQDVLDARIKELEKTVRSEIVEALSIRIVTPELSQHTP